ncbi:non-classical export protein 2 [Trichomonascus vanleenenianus]|uniref:Nce102p n=1 Tax=Trichomonascus vanleenenianus TaxID=2268995 RepID=UPI003ECAB6A1
MVAFVDPILRGTMLVWLTIDLGLIGSLIATQNHTNPQVNFGIFASVFGVVFGCLYGIAAAFVGGIAFPIVMTVIDFFDFVFLFAAATSMAVLFRVHSCNNEAYLKSNEGAQGSTARCRKGQAAIAFLYFSFFTTIALLVYSVMNVMRNGVLNRPSSRRQTAPRTGVPTMTQV